MAEVLGAVGLEFWDKLAEVTRKHYLANIRDDYSASCVCWRRLACLDKSFFAEHD